MCRNCCLRSTRGCRRGNESVPKGFSDWGQEDLAWKSRPDPKRDSFVYNVAQVRQREAIAPRGKEIESTSRLHEQTSYVRLLPDNISCRKDRKSTRLNSSHTVISYAVFC